MSKAGAGRGSRSGAREETAAPAALAENVRQSIAALDLRPEDQAVARLAVRYAETIDRAAAIAAQAAKIAFDPDSADEVARLRAKVSAQATMADLGPKLLAALDALGATPKSRQSAGKTPAAPRASKLAALRSGGAA